MFSIAETQKDRKDVPFRPANLVHTDEAALSESTTSGVGTGSPEPGPLSSVVERRVHIADVVGSTPTAATIRTFERRPAFFVYFVFSMETERIKIGKAADPIERLMSLQTSCPEELRLLAYIYTFNADVLEKALHCDFQSWRVRGEWFECCDPIMDYIQSDASLDLGRLDYLTGRQSQVEPEVEIDTSRPRIPDGVLVPKGNSRKAVLARYKLARGLA